MSNNFCTECGSANSPQSKFCHVCGKSIHNDVIINDKNLSKTDEYSFDNFDQTNKNNSPTQDEIEALGNQNNDVFSAQAAERDVLAKADSGNGEAAALLASVYNDGRPTIRRDAIKAYRYSARAAELGDSFSRYWLAKLQYDAKDFINAYTNARLAHRQGENSASVLLAEMLLEGLGCSPAPLEALDILALQAEKDNDKAARILARQLLSGKIVPKDPTRAFEVINSFDAATLEVFDRIEPGIKADMLYLKGLALTAGAKFPNAPAWTELMASAAALGHTAAAEHIKDHQEKLKREKWFEEWELLTKFEAWGTNWEIFFGSGNLVDVDEKKSSTVGQIGNNITTHTARWKEAVFNVNGNRAVIKFASNVKLVPNRMYHIVYCGIADSGSGTPLTVVDSKEGASYYATGDLRSGYPELTGTTGVKLLTALFVITFGFIFLNSPVIGVLGIAISLAVVIWLGSKSSIKAREAISKAVKHLRKYPA